MEEDRTILAREAKQEILSKYLDTISEDDKLFIFWQLSVWYRGKLVSEMGKTDDETILGLRSLYVLSKEINILTEIEKELIAELF